MAVYTSESGTAECIPTFNTSNRHIKYTARVRSGEGDNITKRTTGFRDPITRPSRLSSFIACLLFVCSLNHRCLGHSSRPFQSVILTPSFSPCSIQPPAPLLLSLLPSSFFWPLPCLSVCLSLYSYFFTLTSFPSFDAKWIVLINLLKREMDRCERKARG